MDLCIKKINASYEVANNTMIKTYVKILHFVEIVGVGYDISFSSIGVSTILNKKMSTSIVNCIEKLKFLKFDNESVEYILMHNCNSKMYELWPYR